VAQHQPKDPAPQRRWDELGELERQQVLDTVGAGRVVGDPRLAAAAVERARHMRRFFTGVAWLVPTLGGLGGLVLPPLLFGDQADPRFALGFAGVLAVLTGAMGLIGYADTTASIHRNQAVLDGHDPERVPSPTRLQRGGALTLGLVGGVVAARLLGWVVFALLSATGLDPDAFPRWAHLAIGLAALLPCWALFTSAILDRYRPSPERVSDS
jgi:hypothetical protein